MGRVEHAKESRKPRRDLMEKCKEMGVVPRTVPQIWIDDAYVGGFQELKNKLDAI